MRTKIKQAALTLALPAMLATGAPVLAATATQHVAVTHASPIASQWGGSQSDGWQHRIGRAHTHDYGRYEEPVYADTQVWRGNDGRYYCRKKNGTTGLIVGGAAGALIGRSLDGGRDRTLGTIIGAAGGALLGREIDRNRGSRRCR